MAFIPEAIVEIMQNVKIQKTGMMQAYVCILTLFCPYPDHTKLWSLLNIWRLADNEQSQFFFYC